MSSNTCGNIFKVTTFGESHGSAIGVIVDGMPSNISIDVERDIQFFLNKRRPGNNIYTSSRKEQDKVTILSGIFNGKTLGTPIALIIYNNDCNSKDYNNIKDIFRPNHGDYSWYKKFSIRDHRGGGRSSARETAVRVAAGALARKILQHYNINLYGSLIQIGNIKINYNNWDYNFIEHNDFFSADREVLPLWKDLICSLKENGDSIGAKIELHIINVPPGLGEPVFDKLDAEIAKAIMSIPAVKSVEIGIGAEAVTCRGSEISDEMYNTSGNNVCFTSNNSGGIQGGISNGNTIVVKFTVKPTSSILIPKQTLSTTLKETLAVTEGRHDPCVGIRAVPVGEAMIAIVIADFILMQRARFNFTTHPQL